MLGSIVKCFEWPLVRKALYKCIPFNISLCLLLLLLIVLALLLISNYLVTWQMLLSKADGKEMKELVGVRLLTQWWACLAVDIRDRTRYTLTPLVYPGRLQRVIVYHLDVHPGDIASSVCNVYAVVFGFYRGESASETWEKPGQGMAVFVGIHE